MATEAKFKVGDRVRRTGYSMWPREYGEVGKEYTVLQVDRAGNPIVIQGANGASPSDFELVAETWRPKVGDRVTANGNTNVNVEEHWNRCFRRSVGDIIDGALIVTSVADHSGGNIGLSNKAGRSHFFMPANTLKPAAPATFTIESGKYYKTRDGRKVGPMVDAKRFFFDAEYPFTVEHNIEGLRYGKAWRVDGTFSTKKGVANDADLIAEWVDEPNASNDNAVPTKPLFKVGDRLKLTRSFYGSALVGATATVGARGMFDRYVDIAWDKNPLTNGQFNGGYYPEYFDLVSSPAASPSAIVALIENGQPKPSAVPHVHATEADAAKEAARLAGKHKGQQFGVFVLTTTSHEAAPTYRYEWQRLAAKGEKIAAIKELRSITGLGLKATKDAVEHWVANDEPYSRVAA